MWTIRNVITTEAGHRFELWGELDAEGRPARVVAYEFAHGAPELEGVDVENPADLEAALLEAASELQSARDAAT